MTAGGAFEANDEPEPPPLEEGPAVENPKPLVLMVGAIALKPLLLPNDDEAEDEAKEPKDVPLEAAVAKGLILA